MTQLRPSLDIIFIFLPRTKNKLKMMNLYKEIYR